MEQTNKPFVYASFAFAFKSAIRNIRPLVIAVAIWTAVIFATVFMFMIVSPLFLLGILFLFPWIYLGIMRMGLQIRDTGHASPSALRPSLLLVIKLLLGFIINQLVTTVLCIFLIWPGIYFLVRAWFYPYALIEGDGIFQSFSTSFRLTHGRGEQIFGFSILQGLFWVILTPLLCVIILIPFKIAETMLPQSPLVSDVMMSVLLILLFIIFIVMLFIVSICNAYAYRQLQKEAS